MGSSVRQPTLGRAGPRHSVLIPQEQGREKLLKGSYQHHLRGLGLRIKGILSYSGTVRPNNFLKKLQLVELWLMVVQGQEIICRISGL